MKDEELRAYGWAPGGYLGGRCHECRQLLEGVAKHSWRCRPCAETVAKERQQIQDEPQICDFPDII